MPFRWKKAKGSSRFSQFVTDHLQSSKRGGSLVVETGFPTSLVDIFVKNRDRMRKSPKKNHCPNSNSTAAAADVPDLIIPTSSPSLNPPNTLSQSVSPIGSATNCQVADEIDERLNPVPDFFNANAGDCIISNVSRAGGGDGLSKTGVAGLFVSALKIFLVVGLALGTKKFVIGITLSSFLLFFLELIGKKLYRRCRPSSESISKLESIVPRSGDDINGGMRIQNDLMNVYSNCSDHSGEIQLVNTKSCSERVSSSGVSLNADFDERLGFEEEIDLNEGLEKEEEPSFGVSEFKHQCLRRARMKSKMKKLVPKNLRKSKKTCSSLKSEGSGSLQSDTHEDRGQCNKMVLDCQGEEQEQEQCNNMVLDCQEEQQMLSKEFHGDGHTICSSGESSLEQVKGIGKVEEEKERPIQRGSGYVGLCLIVLFGLVGGRLVALVLALTWCMMLKILAWRSREVPMPRSLLPKVSNWSFKNSDVPH